MFENMRKLLSLALFWELSGVPHGGLGGHWPGAGDTKVR